jgi:hypothetical protein
MNIPFVPILPASLFVVILYNFILVSISLWQTKNNGVLWMVLPPPLLSLFMMWKVTGGGGIRCVCLSLT